MILLPIPDADAVKRFGPPTYTEAQLRKAYEQGLLDAMNATRPFGRTGEVIAICIAALKETK